MHSLDAILYLSLHHVESVQLGQLGRTNTRRHLKPSGVTRVSKKIQHWMLQCLANWRNSLSLCMRTRKI